MPPLRLLSVAQEERQQADSSSSESHTWTIVACVVVVLLIYAFFSLFLGKVVETALEHYDRRLFGADIEIDSLSISILYARLEVYGCTLKNPLEGSWTGPYVFRVGTMVVDLGWWKMLSTNFKSVEVEELILEDVEFHVEFEGYKGKTNVQRILDFVSENPEGGQQEGAETEPLVEDVEQAPPEPGDGELIVNELKMVHIVAKVSNKLGEKKAELPDICCNNFSQERQAYIPQDILWTILNILNKQFATKLLGQGMADSLFPSP